MQVTMCMMAIPAPYLMYLMEMSGSRKIAPATVVIMCRLLVKKRLGGYTTLYMMDIIICGIKDILWIRQPRDGLKAMMRIINVEVEVEPIITLEGRFI